MYMYKCICAYATNIHRCVYHIYQQRVRICIYAVNIFLARRKGRVVEGEGDPKCNQHEKKIVIVKQWTVLVASVPKKNLCLCVYICL